jgi:hypothetical protein
MEPHNIILQVGFLLLYFFLHFSESLVPVPTHLVIVACHAAIDMEQLDRLSQEESWYLLPYQRGMGYPSIIQSHITRGVDIVKSDHKSVLVFSGGETRKNVGPISEAASYYFVGKHAMLFADDLENRVFLEEFAMDSYENLLFSICRFKEVYDYYPEKVTVVGFDFKEGRFSNIHRKAIKFPADKFSYEGLHAPLPFDYPSALAGEKLAAGAFFRDPYGCDTPSLASKRISRNPFKRTVPYGQACPELEELLNFCGPSIYDKSLPWLQVRSRFRAKAEFGKNGMYFVILLGTALAAWLFTARKRMCEVQQSHIPRYLV